MQSTYVNGYPDGSGGFAADRTVYPRVYHSACGCSPDFTECGGTDEPVCYETGYDLTVPPTRWQMTGVVGPGPLTGGELVSQIADNYFKNDGTMQDYPSHCTYGWKAVLAKAWWQGRWGFTTGSCCDSSTPQVKYRNQTEVTVASARVTTTPRDCTGAISGAVTVDVFTVSTTKTASVDDHGNIRRSGSSIVTSYSSTDGVESPHQTWIDENHPGFKPTGLVTCDHLIPAGDLTLDATCGVITFGGATTGHFVAEQTGTAAELNALDLFPVDNIVADDPCAIASSAYQNVTGSPIRVQVGETQLDISWSISGRATIRECCLGVPTDTSTTDVDLSYSKTVSLGAPETYSQVLARAAELLSHYPLTDDRVYPWRTDSQTWLLPVVTTDSGVGVPSVAGFNEFGETQDSILYSGEIRGMPLPAGYGPFFNYFHTKWCAFIDGGNCTPCPEELGELGASPIPPTATQWVEKDVGADSRGPGAHIYNVVGGQYGIGTPGPVEGVLAQKWAETLVKWPSINFSRPCGRDRYLFDESEVACVVDFSGTDLELATSPAVEFEVGDKIVINDGGVYQVATKTDAQNYTVGAKLYDTLIPCDGASKLRFPNARAICSTLAATATQSAPGVVSVSTPTAHWLKGGGTESDTITFAGIAGLTSAVATELGTNAFSVPGTLVTDPSTGTISHGATSGEIAFDTTCSRNTFVVREWLDESVTNSEVTLAPISRHPTVLYSSPNDVFPHGYSVPWGSIAADLCLGSQWSVRFDQAIADPFWQADHSPCDPLGFEWVMRETPCEDPDDNHYAFPPLVEAKMTTPSGAPTLPVTFFTSQGIPGPIGHPNCEIDPYTTGIPMSWRAGWLTCTDWEALIGHKCATG